MTWTGLFRMKKKKNETRNCIFKVSIWYRILIDTEFLLVNYLYPPKVRNLFFKKPVYLLVCEN